jgi:hypothetical protein
MSIVLAQEVGSPNEAYITWTIDSSLISSSSKGFLYLTDIGLFNTGIASFPIVKYQLRFGELLSGSHIFEDLGQGSYIVELSIVTGNTSLSSDPLTVNVRNLVAPLFNNVIPSNTYFTISLVQPSELIQNVTFILIGKLIVGGITQSIFENSTTVSLPYNNLNSYVISNLVNNNEYEVACFYTDIYGTSSVLSETLAETPTNSPNQITTLAAIYDSVGQTLTITHNMPNNAIDYDLIDCRATITDAYNNVFYYYSSENSALLVPAPTAADSVVFNMNNQQLLSVDTPFTITLSVKNEMGLWGPVESPALYCIHPFNYHTNPLVVSDLTYVVGLNSISTSDNLTYSKNNTYVINYSASVFECDASGVIIGSAVASVTQDNLNFNFNGLVAGLLYKLVLNVSYLYTFADATTATIEELVFDTCYYYFIPHDIPEQLGLAATPSVQGVLVNWTDLSVSELQGFLLDHYEVSSDNVNWVNVGIDTYYTFTGLTNGSSYTFFARPVSVSGSSFYMSGQMVLGQTNDITSVPYGQPDAPVLVSQMPGDQKVTVVWVLTDSPYNGGLFNVFQASVNTAGYADIAHSFANGQYTFEFDNLTNLVTNSIEIKLVTNNVSNANNVDTVKYSNSLVVVTIPFTMPAIPTGFTSSPSANTVTLGWNSATPAEIINNNVEYELYYKLAADSEFTVVSNIATNTYSVTGLTSNLMYDFKIRSTILNVETGNTFSRAFTNVIQGRPFVYSGAPVMNLVAGQGATIVVQLSPNSNNYFNTMFKYHATITDIDGNNANSATLINIANTNQQSITFTTLGDSSVLVDLEQYRIVAYYEMLNTDNLQYYSSNTTTNVIEPYNAELAPVLESVSHSQMISLSVDVTVFVGYDIVNYQVSFDAVSWTIVSMNSTADLNVFTTDIALDQNGSVLANGSTYNLYAQILYIQNGENYTSSTSNMVTNIPYTTSSAPTNIQSEPSSQQVIVSWSAPANLGGLGLHHYEVKMDSNDWSSIGTELSHLFTGLTNGQSHTFFVRPVTINVLENNQMIYGASASTVNISYAPEPIPAFNAMTELNTRLLLQWFDVGGSGGLNFHHYEVALNQGAWYDVGTWVSHEFTGLTNGQGYTCSVRIVTTHPYIGLINGNVFTTPLLYPYAKASAPIFVSCNQRDSQLLLNWSASTSLGGLSFNRFEVSLNQLNWVDVNSVTSYLFDELINGSSNIMYVRSVTTHPNLGVIRGTVLTTSSFVPYKKPSAVTLNDYDALVVNADSNLFGLPLLHYELSLNNGVSWTSDINVNFGNNTIWVNPTKWGLYFQTGVVYSFQFRAVTTHPNLGPIVGDVYTINFIPYDLSLNTIVTSGSVPSDSQVIINWEAFPSPNVNGLIFDHFVVGIGPDTGNVIWIDIPNSQTSYTFTGLTNGEFYTFVIKAILYRQYAPVSYVSSRISSIGDAPYQEPSPVTNITSIPKNGDVVYSWTPTTQVMGGLPFGGYQISDDNINWTTYNYLGYYDARDASWTGPNGVLLTLYIRIRRVHPTLGGVFSPVASNTNMPYARAEPFDSNSYVTVPGNQQIELSWSPRSLEQLGGLPLDHYAVYISTTQTWITVPNNQTSYTITGLTNGQSYPLMVKAITLHPYIGLVDGRQPYSFGYDTPYTQSAMPVNITAIPSDQGVSISWDRVTDFGGLAFSSYYISTDLSNWDTVYTNNYTATGLTNGDTYTFYITTITTHPNLGMIIGNMNSITNIVPYAIAVAPVISSVAGDANIHLSWTAPDLGGLSIAYYKLSYNGSVWYNLNLNTDPNITFTVNNSSASVTLNGLTNGETYTYYVAAVTLHPFLGEISGDSSNISKIPFSSPNAVSNLGCSVINNVLRFSFTATSDANNNAFIPYYEYSIDDLATFLPIYQLVSYTTSFLNDNVFSLNVRSYILDPNNQTTHINGNVAVLNNLQNVNVTTPQNLQATVGNETVMLTWTATPSVIFQVLQYFPDGTVFRAFTSNSSYTFTGLTNGTTYNFGVNIYIGNTPGPVSNISAKPMTNPIINSVTKNGDILNLDINFGGSSSIDINFGAFFIQNNEIAGTNISTTIAYSPSVNPISFSGMSSYTYFSIAVSNSVGSISGSYSV